MERFDTMLKAAEFAATQVKFCTKCGSGVVPGARFCGKCGNRLGDVFE
jgi:uncharacterized OB-fold protein